MYSPIQLINSLSQFREYLEKQTFSKLFVLCDTNTQALVYPQVEKELKEVVEVHLLVVEAGESSKDWKVCLSLWEKMSELNADRKSLLLNLGGGMITDLGAFVASVYKRGIPFIHLPTSLLGMTDAAIGGKCGIDFMNYKNQLGLFASPQAIFVYPPFLESLPQEELKSGFAEVLKHALIADASYWQDLKEVKLENWESVAAYIEKSLAIKNQVVQEDPLEKGLRKKLNFGHTIGHAIESYFLQKDSPIPHGFAVVAGMIIESWLSMRYANLAIQQFEEIVEVLLQFYKGVDFSKEEMQAILAFLQQDKKAEEGENRFTLLSAIGEAVIDINIKEEHIRSALLQYLSLYEKA